MSESLRDILSDTLAFAERHNLNAVSLLQEIAQSMPAKTESTTGPEQQPKSPQEILCIVKEYWTATSQKFPGFVATAHELYDACGFEFPRRHHALSYWLTSSPEAQAVSKGHDAKGHTIYGRANSALPKP